VIINFMSHSVMNAFTTGAGITIAISQMKYLFGIEVSRQKYTWQTLGYIISHLDETKIGTLVLAVCCIAFLLGVKQWKKYDNANRAKANAEAKAADPSAGPVETSCCKKVIKFAADLSALIMCILASVAAGCYNMSPPEGVGIATVGEVPSGMPALEMIDVEGGLDALESMVPTAAIIAVVGFLESMAVGQTFATKYKYDIDADQEFMAIGIANLVGSFFQGFPVVGSFSRTAVNGNSGARSTFANALTGLIVMIGLVALAPIGAFKSLPFAALAAMIITSVESLVMVDEFVHAYHADRRDFGVMVLTLLVVLGLGVKEGLFVGFVASIVANLQCSAYPNICELGVLPVEDGGGLRDIENFETAETYDSILIVRVDARIFFANCAQVRQFVLARLHVYSDGDGEMSRTASTMKGLAEDDEGRFGDRPITHVIFDMRATNEVDLSGLHMLQELCRELQTFTNNEGIQMKTIDIAFGNCKKNVRDRFKKSHLIQEMYGENAKHEDYVFNNMKKALQKYYNKPQETVTEALETICTKCGNKFMADAMFCRKCGNARKLETVKSAADRVQSIMPGTPRASPAAAEANPLAEAQTEKEDVVSSCCWGGTSTQPAQGSKTCEEDSDDDDDHAAEGVEDLPSSNTIDGETRTATKVSVKGGTKSLERALTVL